MICSTIPNYTLDDLIPFLQFLDHKYLILDMPISDLPIIGSIQLISRLSISEKNTPLKEIKKKLQTLRHKYHLIEIEPTSPGVASFIVQDNRVDIIKLNHKLGLKIINAKYGNRIIQENKILSLDLSFMYRNNQARELRQYMRYFASFGSRFIPIHLDQQVTQPYDLRSYRGLQAIGRIMGLTNKQTSPRILTQRIERNKKKLSGQIPFEGVEEIGSED